MLGISTGTLLADTTAVKTPPNDAGLSGQMHKLFYPVCQNSFMPSIMQTKGLKQSMLGISVGTLLADTTAVKTPPDDAGSSGQINNMFYTGCQNTFMPS